MEEGNSLLISAIAADNTEGSYIFILQMHRLQFSRPISIFIEFDLPVFIHHIPVL